MTTFANIANLRLLYADGQAKVAGQEVTESRFDNLKIVSCEALVQHIDIPEFHISERLPRPTYRLNSAESSTIYISRRSTSRAMSLYYLSDPLAAYLGVPDASGDIRTILNTPDDLLTELCTVLLKIPDLPDSWTETSESPNSSFNELASVLTPSRIRSQSVILRNQEIDLAVDHLVLGPEIPEISNEEALSIMERLKHFIKNQDTPGSPTTSSERPESPRLSSSRPRSRKPKKVQITSGPGGLLELNLPPSRRRNSEQSYKAKWAPWKTPDLSPLISHRKRFQRIESTDEPPNSLAGFAGEYFVTPW